MQFFLTHHSNTLLFVVPKHFEKLGHNFLSKKQQVDVSRAFVMMVFQTRQQKHCFLSRPSKDALHSKCLKKDTCCYEGRGQLNQQAPSAVSNVMIAPCSKSSETFAQDLRTTPW